MTYIGLRLRISPGSHPAALAPTNRVDIEIQAVITGLFYWPNGLAVNSRRQRSWRPELFYVAVIAVPHIVISPVPSSGVFIYRGNKLKPALTDARNYIHLSGYCLVY
jgi:hypothetical protein